MEKRSYLPEIAASLMATIFGMSFMFTKLALANHSPIELIAHRFLLAFAVMSILVFLKIIKIDLKGKNMKNLFFLSFAQPVLYFIFESYGIKYSASSQAGIMVALIPVVVAILGVLFLGEKNTKQEIFFILLSVAGVMYIAYGKQMDENSSMLGIILLLCAVISSSAYSIISRKISKEFTSAERTYAMMLYGALAFNLINIVSHVINNNINEYFSPWADPSFFFALIYLGILSSIVAFFLSNYSLTHLEASKASVFSNLATVVSIIMGVVFLKESFSIHQIWGSLMILVGVFGTQYTNVMQVKRASKN